MSWYYSEGKSPHNAIFSRTRYLRNIAGIPFPIRAGEKVISPYFTKIDSLLSKNGFRKETLTVGDTIQLMSLAEKGFVDSAFLSGNTPRAIYFNEPCSLAIALGGRDLISICSILSGKALSDTRNIASGAEVLMDGAFEFAYTDQGGYISSTPACCGSGAEFSALLYLPALDESALIPKWHRLCRMSGSELSPAFTYPEDVGHLYTLTHSPSHRCDETVAAEGFDALVDKIIDEERSLERIIFAQRSRIIIDRAWRAYGALLYSRRLDERDLLSLSSDIRFALSSADENAKLPPVKISLLNTLLGEGLNASTVASRGSCPDEEDCMRVRAEHVSKLIFGTVGNQA